LPELFAWKFKLRHAVDYRMPDFRMTDADGRLAAIS
jgi:hypothetical protein